MDGAEISAAVILGITFLLLVGMVLAPWRSLRRDALDQDEYYAVLSGEEPEEDTLL